MYFAVDVSGQFADIAGQVDAQVIGFQCLDDRRVHDTAFAVEELLWPVTHLIGDAKDGFKRLHLSSIALEILEARKARDGYRYKAFI